MSNLNKLASITIAAAAGFVAGILLAPKSGKETRQDIKEKAHEAKDYVSDKAGRVKHAAHDSYESIREGASDIGGEFTKFTHRTKPTVEKIAREAKTSGSSIVEKAGRTSRQVKKDIKDNLK